jgi:hypothetical protein
VCESIPCVLCLCVCTCVCPLRGQSFAASDKDHLAKVMAKIKVRTL